MISNLLAMGVGILAYPCANKTKQKSTQTQCISWTILKMKLICPIDQRRESKTKLSEENLQCSYDLV